MPSIDTATMTETRPAEAAAPAVPAIYRTTAHLRAHWLNHRLVADLTLAITLLGLAAAALIAAR
ncbi:hypothetical protein [Kribbella sp. CA-294648]|uniref:hypothetical protein n=1 Tax=Kribbella sp. CA-294648 TaxID=3239948 RepID=UPI003D8A4BED